MTSDNVKKKLNVLCRINNPKIVRTIKGNIIVNFKIKKENLTTLLKNISGGKKNQINSRYRLLSIREIQILKYVSEGKTNIEIAEKLMLSKHTIKAHVANILQKMSVTDRVQAAVKAVCENIID
ncbi:MAG: LuxR C-terminal-related transcriptional regulator [Candidatus Gastranaerophilales bacterium]|nr:LuxR C-terminal-related transcriptional regulator [Candidatus Gastranaerophilales bacterium]